MNDSIKLVDGTMISFEEGYTLDRIVHIAESEEEALTVCAAFTPANLKRIEFWSPGAETYWGVHEDLIAIEPPLRQTLDSGHIRVIISLREKTDLEKRLDALEESQQIQDGAIEDIGMVLSDMAEG